MITGNELIHSVVKPGFLYSDGSYEVPTVEGGLTIRQHFAAMAMQGLIMNKNYVDPDYAAITSCKYADALIAELNKSQMAIDREIQDYLTKITGAGSSPDHIMERLLETYPGVKKEYRRWYNEIENTIEYAFEKQF